MDQRFRLRRFDASLLHGFSPSASPSPKVSSTPRGVPFVLWGTAESLSEMKEGGKVAARREDSPNGDLLPPSPSASNARRRGVLLPPSPTNRKLFRTGRSFSLLAQPLLLPFQALSRLGIPPSEKRSSQGMARSRARLVGPLRPFARLQESE